MSPVREQRPYEMLPSASQVTAQSETFEPIFHGQDDLSVGLLLRNVIRSVWQSRWLVLAATALVSLLVGAAVMALPPVYDADSTVLIRNETQGNPSFLTGVAAVVPRAGFDTPERRLETEMQLAVSRPVLEAAIDEIKPTWSQLYHSPMAHTIEPLMLAYERVSVRWFNMPPSTDRDRESMVEALERSIRIGPVKTKGAEVTSNLVKFELRAADPAIARDLLGSLVRHYMQLQADLVVSSAREALELLAAEKAEAARETMEARDRLQKALLRGQTRGEPGRAAALTDNGSVPRLKSEILETELTLADARSLYFDQADTVVRLQRRLNALREQLARDVSAGVTVRSVADEEQARVRAAEVREEELSRKEREIELLTRSNALLNNDRLVVEEARLPRTSDWKVRLSYVVMGIIGGVLLGVSLAGVRHATNRTVSSVDAARRLIGRPSLGALPMLPERVMTIFRSSEAPPSEVKRGASVRVLSPKLRSRAEQYAEQMDLLATRVMAQFETGGGGDAFRARTILVTSARKGEGKSTVASCLVSTLERLTGERVLLIHSDATESTRAGDYATTAQGPLNGGRDVVALADTGGWVPFGLTKAGSANDWVIIDAHTLGTGVAEQAVQQVDLALLVIDSQRTGAQVVIDALTDVSYLTGVAVALVLNKIADEPPPWLLDRF